MKDILINDARYFVPIYKFSRDIRDGKYDLTNVESFTKFIKDFYTQKNPSASVSIEDVVKYLLKRGDKYIRNNDQYDMLLVDIESLVYDGISEPLIKNGLIVAYLLSEKVTFKGANSNKFPGYRDRLNADIKVNDKVYLVDDDIKVVYYVTSIKNDVYTITDKLNTRYTITDIGRLELIDNRDKYIPRNDIAGETVDIQVIGLFKGMNRCATYSIKNLNISSTLIASGIHKVLELTEINAYGMYNSSNPTTKLCVVNNAGRIHDIYIDYDSSIILFVLNHDYYIINDKVFRGNPYDIKSNSSQQPHFNQMGSNGFCQSMNQPHTPELANNLGVRVVNVSTVSDLLSRFKEIYSLNNLSL